MEGARSAFDPRSALSLASLGKLGDSKPRPTATQTQVTETKVVVAAAKDEERETPQEPPPSRGHRHAGLGPRTLTSPPAPASLRHPPGTLQAPTGRWKGLRKA
ncbi:hypothetical protein NDU88_006588 [Pleurodeles waltl]|uniref:Uncharacterized protein n=1 Tax=Pleurodeles waltl TaxID=8319 RepID=A0AAV7MCP1_PLEWA|nr:hypothetical protein NDU88_006588 [Pleurodeles waltl]